MTFLNNSEKKHITRDLPTVFDATTLIELPIREFAKEVQRHTYHLSKAGGWKAMNESVLGLARSELYRSYSEFSQNTFGQALLNKRNNQPGLTIPEAGKLVKERLIDTERRLHILGAAFGKSYDSPNFFYARIRTLEGAWQGKGVTEEEFKQHLRSDEFCDDIIRWLDVGAAEKWAAFVVEIQGHEQGKAAWDNTLKFSRPTYMAKVMTHNAHKLVEKANKFPNEKRRMLMDGESKPNNSNVYYGVEAVLRTAYNYHIGYHSWLVNKLDFENRQLQRLIEESGDEHEFAKDAQNKVAEIEHELNEVEGNFADVEAICLKVLNPILPTTGNAFVAYAYNGMLNRLNKEDAASFIREKREALQVDKFHAKAIQRLADIDKYLENLPE